MRHRKEHTTMHTEKKGINYTNRTRLNLRINQDLLNRIEEIRKEKKMTFANVIEDLILKGLAQ